MQPRSWQAACRQALPGRRCMSIKDITPWVSPWLAQYRKEKTDAWGSQAGYSVAVLASPAFGIRHELELVLDYLMHRIAAANRRYVHGVLQRTTHGIDESRVRREDHAETVTVHFTRGGHDELDHHRSADLRVVKRVGVRGLHWPCTVLPRRDVHLRGGEYLAIIDELRELGRGGHLARRGTLDPLFPLAGPQHDRATRPRSNAGRQRKSRRYDRARVDLERLD